METGETKKFRKITRFGNLLKSNRNNCFYCQCKLDDYSRTVDHLVPASKGGIRSNDNKVFSCRDCNQLKANLDPYEFKMFLERVITLEISSFKKKTGYLKKVLINVNRLIEDKHDRTKKSKRIERP